ncbi:hypothetical protein AMTRI_Chr04g243190 [Amborella trichopoda]
MAAAASTLSLTAPVTSVTPKTPFIKPLSPIALIPLRAQATKRSHGGALIARASLKEKAVAGLTAAALTAIMVIPDVAEAAQPGISPSLKNFLLSIVAGGVVLAVLLGAVIGVANFDPVKRT